MTIPTGFPTGWGAETWGSGPDAGYWGGSESSMTALSVLSVIALRENLIQVVFSEPIYYSGLYDPPDGSNPARYVLSTVAGTTGLDGTSVRPCYVAATVEAGSPSALTADLPPGVQFGAAIDLTLDRPMTPYPAQYLLTCNGLFSANLVDALNPSASSGQFPAVFKQLLAPSVDLPTPTRDIANPQSRVTAQGTVNPFNPLHLGVFVTDDQHDYAADSGLISFRKRVYRRLVTNPGGFLHLGASYGVGIPRYGKKLATASVQQALAATVQTQIAQEPEVSAVGCTVFNDQNTPGLVRFNLRIRLKSGKTYAYSQPFSSM